ncbi:hypothetical protein [Micromonospora sp. WMMD736]|uniref:hypothetical protein n=1 Tax=Micromonospora sp. WMMD736 TaxID=3404112 RepID=UPI003B967368
MRIFEYTDNDGDCLTVEDYGSSDHPDVAFVTREGAGDVSAVYLPPTQVAELVAALRPLSPAAADDLAQAYQNGRTDAIDDHQLVTREEHEAALTAAAQPGALDPARVEALNLAAAVAKDLRSSGPLVSAGAVGHEPVLAYALFLLDLLPVPVAQQ